jgi:hypothetical protein
VWRTTDNALDEDISYSLIHSNRIGYIGESVDKKLQYSQTNIIDKYYYKKLILNISKYNNYDLRNSHHIISCKPNTSQKNEYS